ncbi:MAG: hypothetical protein ACRCZP_11805 [Phycicoccus sp.]
MIMRLESARPVASTVVEDLDVAVDGLDEDLSSGGLVSDILMAARVHLPDGSTEVRVGWNPGIDWVVRRGLSETLRDVVREDDRFDPDAA